MNRRDFLKSMAGVAVSLSLPKIAESTYNDFDNYAPPGHGYSHFNENEKYGNYLVLSENIEDISGEQLLAAKNAIEGNIIDTIPPSFRNKVVYLYNASSLGWKYSPSHKGDSFSVTSRAIDALVSK